MLEYWMNLSMVCMSCILTLHSVEMLGTSTCICNSTGKSESWGKFCKFFKNGSEIARGTAECNFAVFITSRIYNKISLIPVLSLYLILLKLKF